MTKDPQLLASYFDYLDALRVSGVTNMYGAAAYLVEEFGLPPAEAKETLLAWMHTYSDEPPYRRAEKALLR